MSVLAIDQSTTSTTAFLFDEKGCAQKLGSHQHRQIHPRQGWVEHDPLEILTHVQACLAAGKNVGAQVLALSNQGESCLAWDRSTGAPISRIIVWQDARTEAQCRALEAKHSDLVTARARLPIASYFSATKLGWIMEHIPAAADLARAGNLCLGTTDAFLRHRLTGRFETDVATASRTSLMNLETGTWDPELCAVFGVPIECLPEIGSCSGDLGSLDGLRLSAAIVDQQGALFGHGLKDPGQMKFTFGTGAFAQTLVGATCPPYAHGVLPTVAWRKDGDAPVFALDGGIHTAASAVDWARKLGLFADFSELYEFSGHALSRGLVFVPALAGLASPHWHNEAKGTWLGLSLATSKAEMMQAMLEGIAYRAHEVCAAMEKIAPIQGAISVDGGMTQNPWFCQLLANVMGHDIQRADTPDITAFGAAQMAAQAHGVVLPKSASHDVFEPNLDFEPAYDRFAQACRLAKDWSRSN